MAAQDQQREIDLRILGDNGDFTVVTVTDMVTNCDDLSQRAVDAIMDEFEGDGVTVEASGYTDD